VGKSVEGGVGGVEGLSERAELGTSVTLDEGESDDDELGTSVALDEGPPEGTPLSVWGTHVPHMMRQ